MYQRKLYAGKSLEFFGLVSNRLSGMHGLHAQYLIIALLVVEHGGREILKHIFSHERTISLYPFVPDEEAMAIVIGRVQVDYVHGNVE